MSLLDLLVAGKVDEFNQTRGERARLDFFAADLAGVDLTGVDLTGANVEKADLSGARLVGASLFKARLVGIDGSDLDLTEALAARVVLDEAWLEGATLTDAELTQASLREATLNRTSAERVRLAGARLTEAEVRDAVWPHADLSEASMHKAVFAGADLGAADLTEANATAADFSGARLDGVVASRARLQGAIFKGASLVAARLDEANLSEADLTGADLSGADLSGANLSKAVLTGATLRGAMLAGAVLDGVDLAGLDLADVDLTGVDPTALGLSEDQLGQVAAVGAAASLDAPLRVADVRAAAVGDAVLAFWENDDGDEAHSLRWALTGPGIARLGVLPIGADGLLARAVAATADGFELLVFQERPGGVALLAWTLSAAGEVLRSRSENLGYAPAIAPIARADGDGVLLWCLARRGPTLVVQRLGADGLAPVHSQGIPTARGFLGRHQPLLACKGEVWMAVGADGVARPLGSPDGFPGTLGVATPVGERVFAAWATAPRRNRPGELVAAALQKRGAPELELVANVTALVDLDALGVGEDLWLCWADKSADGLAVWRSKADGVPQRLEVDAEDVTEVRFAPGPLGAAGTPAVVVVSKRGEARFYGRGAAPVGRVGGA